MPNENTGGGSFITDHPTLAIGGAVLLLLLLGASLLKKNAASTTGAQDLTGLNNGIVYVPTSTEFYTDNSITAAKGATVTSGNTTSTSTTTTTTTPLPVVLTPIPWFPPTHPIPVPGGGTSTGGVVPPHHNPPSKHGSGSLKWTRHYSVRGGDTLSKIASMATNDARKAGAPGNVLVTWQQIYNYNKSTIDQTAAAHHSPIPGGAANNVFPGESLIIPQWSK